MMTFRAGSRIGDHVNFQRELFVKDESGERRFVLTMATRNLADGRHRFASIANATEIVWQGELETDREPANPKSPNEDPPFRACALAAGLCDAAGINAELTPEWAVPHGDVPN